MYNEITANKRRSVVLAMLFIAILIGLGYVIGLAQGDTTYSYVWLAVGISLFSTGISYFFGDKIALGINGATPIAKEENPYLYRLVENLCIADGIPLPKIYIINDLAINAFATGRKPEMASIAVTAGALQKLTNEELEGVLAHELSHVKNYDIRFMMLVAIMVGAISIVSDIFLRSRWFGRRRGNSENGAGGFLLIAGIVLAILSPFIAELIKLAISRRREYLADATGALLTRYPEGLASALEKIAADAMPMQRANTATAHLFFANPLNTKNLSALFSTHPPLADRIQKLRSMGQ